MRHNPVKRLAALGLYIFYIAYFTSLTIGTGFVLFWLVAKILFNDIVRPGRSAR